jgi:hypothetical protein
VGRKGARSNGKGGEGKKKKRKEKREKKKKKTDKWALKWIEYDIEYGWVREKLI